MLIIGNLTRFEIAKIFSTFESIFASLALQFRMDGHHKSAQIFIQPMDLTWKKNWSASSENSNFSMNIQILQEFLPILCEKMSAI